jgi:hypothetical protein
MDRPLQEKARWLADNIPTLFISSVYKNHLEGLSRAQQATLEREEREARDKEKVSSYAVHRGRLPGQGSISAASGLSNTPVHAQTHARNGSISSNTEFFPPTPTHAANASNTAAAPGVLRNGSPALGTSASTGSLLFPTGPQFVDPLARVPVRMPTYLAPLIPLDPAHPETVIVDFAPGTNAIDTIGQTHAAGGKKRERGEQENKQPTRTSLRARATAASPSQAKEEPLVNVPVNPNVAVLQARALAAADAMAARATSPTSTSPKRGVVANPRSPSPNSKKRAAAGAAGDDSQPVRPSQHSVVAHEVEGVTASFHSGERAASAAALPKDSELSIEDAEEKALLDAAENALRRRSALSKAPRGSAHRGRSGARPSSRPSRKVAGIGAGVTEAASAQVIPGLAASHHSHVFLPNIAATAASNHNAERAAANVALLTRLHEQALELDTRAAKERAAQQAAANYQAHLSGHSLSASAIAAASSGGPGVSVLPSGLSLGGDGSRGALVLDHREFAPDDQEYAHPLEVGMRREPKLMHFQQHRQSMAIMQQFKTAVGRGRSGGKGPPARPGALLSNEELHAISMQRKLDEGTREDDGDSGKQSTDEEEEGETATKPGATSPSAQGARRPPVGAALSASSSVVPSVASHSVRLSVSSLSVDEMSPGDLHAMTRAPFSPTHEYAETPMTPFTPTRILPQTANAQSMR